MDSDTLGARRGWVGVVGAVADARLVVAGLALRRDERKPAREFYVWIRSAMDAWLAQDPDDADALVRRAHACWGLAQLEASTTDPAAIFAAARADLLRATELTPDDPTPWRDLLHLEGLAADADRAWGRDPLALLRDAHAVADRWLARPLEPDIRAGALALRGAAAVSLAKRLLDRGEPMDAEYEGAMADLAEAQALQPDDPDLAGTLGHAHLLAGDRAMTRGESPREALTRSLACYRELQRGAEGPGPAHRHALAVTLATYGNFCGRWGEDPSPFFAEALALATALEAEVGVPDMPELTGTVHVHQAEVEFAAHRDPTAACRGALEAFARARERRGGRVTGLASRRQANALYLRGRWEQLQGVDPTRSLMAAADAYGAAIELAGLDPSARADRSLVHVALGEWAAATGGDPRPHYREALADQDAVVAALPKNAGALHSRGVTHRALAQAQFQRGEDPSEALGRARDDLNLAIAHDATSPDRLNDRGLLFRTWAEILLAASESAELQLRLALQDFDRALELAPDHRAARNNRGNTWSSVAKTQRWREEDPRDALRRGLADFDWLLAAAPDDMDAWSNRGLLHQEMGDAERGWGDGDADAHYALAVADFDAALARNPRSVAAYTNRGVVHVSRGHAAEAAGRDPRPHHRAAVQDHTAALALAPGDPGVLVNRAAARSALATARATAGEPADTVAAARAAGLVDADGAVGANPRLWQAHALRGRLLADLQRRDEALTAYDAALTLHPGHPTVLAWRRALVEGER